MSNGKDEDTTHEGSIEAPDVANPSGYKVLGEADLDGGVGVLGRNTADSGTPIGVKGTVPNNATGYGLETPDDLRVGGQFETETPFELDVGGDLLAEITDEYNGNGPAVTFGHSSNGVLGSGSVVAGGGYDDGTTADPNQIVSDYATVSGGRNNEIRGLDSNYSTIGGGRDNKVGPDGNAIPYATIGGGDGNKVKNAANYSTVGGGESNEVRGTADHATVAGGELNVVETGAHSSSVGGGRENRVKSGAYDGVVAGGFDNEVSGHSATVCGGVKNVAGGATGGDGNDREQTVAGGSGNEATASGAAVGGGSGNTAGGSQATVPGGLGNTAEADHTFAAGKYAKARAPGAFVWGDSSGNTVESTTDDEVVFQAGGGVTLWSSSDFSSKVKLYPGDSSWTQGSSRTIKSAIEPVDPETVLTGVEDLTVSTWEYDARPGVTHMGPMAEDFGEAFGLGEDPERISSVDADGVALAAIKGLADRLRDRDERIEVLETENERLEERLSAVEDRLAALESPPTEVSPADD